MDDPHRPPPLSGAARRACWIRMAVFAGLALVSFWGLSYLNRRFGGAANTENLDRYVAATATITRWDTAVPPSHFTSSSYCFYDLTYTYEVDGITFTSSRYSLDCSSLYVTPDPLDLKIPDKYEVGTTHTIWYDPRAPHLSVMTKNRRRAEMSSGLFSPWFWLCFFLVLAALNWPGVMEYLSRKYDSR